MSLLDDFAKTCIMLEKTRVPDGEGGWITAWTDGAEFKNYMGLSTTMEARIAEKEGVTSLYSALVDMDCPIELNDVFRDVKTGLTYRVTSDPKEQKTPGSSSFLLKFFTAERWNPAK